MELGYVYTVQIGSDFEVDRWNFLDSMKGRDKYMIKFDPREDMQVLQRHLDFLAFSLDSVEQAYAWIQTHQGWVESCLHHVILRIVHVQMLVDPGLLQLQCNHKCLCQ